MGRQQGTTRDDILKRIQEHRSEIGERFDVERLGVFGSAARDELAAGSDVDVLVAFASGPTYTTYLGLKRFLESLVDRPVDLVTESGLKPRARTNVERELIRVA